MPQVVGRTVESEDEKLRLLDRNLGFEAKLEDSLLKSVDEGADSEVVRSSVTVGKRGGEEVFGK